MTKMTDFEKMIYQPLIDRRLQLGLTMKDVAKSLRKDKSEIGRFERVEQNTYNLKLIKQYCDVYDLDVMVTYKVKDQK